MARSRYAKNKRRRRASYAIVIGKGDTGPDCGQRRRRREAQCKAAGRRGGQGRAASSGKVVQRRHGGRRSHDRGRGATCGIAQSKRDIGHRVVGLIAKCIGCPLIDQENRGSLPGTGEINGRVSLGGRADERFQIF